MLSVVLRFNEERTACKACKLVCPPDCIVQHPDFVESPEELQSKYESLHCIPSDLSLSQLPAATGHGWRWRGRNRLVTRGQ